MSLTKQVSCYHQSQDVALAFSDLLYKKEHPEAKYSKSPGAAQKVLRKTSGATAPETAGEESDGGVSAIQTGPAGGGSVQEHQAQETAQVEEAPAMIIARKLIEMGDRIDRGLPAELRNRFEEEFKNTSVFSFAYDHFSSVCLSFLSNAQDRIHAGWEQAYLLYYGHYVVSQELKRQSVGDDSADRVESMSIVVRDLMHEIRLDEWIDNQGGWNTDATAAINGASVVQVPCPPSGPQGSSVD